MTSSPRFLTTTDAAARLESLAYVERAVSHVLAGWIVRTQDLDRKIAWGQFLSASMEQASRLRDRASALRAGGEGAPCLPLAWREVLKKVDASGDTSSVLRGLGGAEESLAGLYQDYLDRADPVADAGSVQIVESGERTARAQMKWLYRQAGDGKRAPRLARRTRGGAVAAAEALWPPLDRRPRVARPDWMPRGEPGALRLLPLHPRKDTALFLHNFLNEEFTTLELVTRNSYEHPEMPWAFHRDAARHAGDEARHAQLFVRALQDYGIHYGDYPIYTYSYEGEYEFPPLNEGEPAPCEPGSRRELLWRILLRQVVHEGLALDSTPFEVRKREYLKQPELARIFGYTLADEVFHAGSGIKWAHYLVSGDEGEFQREREEAYGYYSSRLRERRLRWGAAHIAEAAAETEQLEKLEKNYRFPFGIEVNAVGRRRAGFSEEDIRRARTEH